MRMDQIKASRSKAQQEIEERSRFANEAASHFSDEQYQEFFEAHKGVRLRLGNSTSFRIERDTEFRDALFTLHHENPPSWVNEKSWRDYDSGQYTLSPSELIRFVKEMKGCVDMIEYFEKKDREAERVDATQEINVEGFGEW